MRVSLVVVVVVVVVVVLSAEQLIGFLEQLHVSNEYGGEERKKVAENVAVNGASRVWMNTNDEEEKEEEEEEEKMDEKRRRRNMDYSIVAVGSYEHEKKTQLNFGTEEEKEKEERVGRVTLFRCSRSRMRKAQDNQSASSRARDENISFEACGELDETSRARCGGAFDLKFGNASRRKGGKVELAMACANNRLEIFEMTMEEDAKDDDEGKDQIQKQLVRLKPTAQFDCQFGGIGLCTSAAWSCRDASIVATGDDGAAVVVDYERAMMASYGSEGDNSQVLFRVENAHADAIWASSFLDGSEDVFFTGGDDCKLVKHDLREMKRTRTSGDEEEPSNFAYPSPTSQNFRFEKNPVFDAGVTSIESKGDFLYVGSYDGACRAFDVRKSLKEPTWISRGDDDEKEEGNDASIWRVRLHPNFSAFDAGSNKIALASMKAGCRVISSLDGSTVGTYRNGHDDDKVVYGCDWAFVCDDGDKNGEEDEYEEGFVSCSFYDKRVHVWTL